MPGSPWMLLTMNPACAREHFALQERLERIGIADLRFLHDEIAALLIGRSIPAISDILAELVTHTEGGAARITVRKEDGGFQQMCVITVLRR